MNSALEKLLLSELRIVVYEPGPAPGSPEHAPAPGSAEASSAQKPLLDKQITKAMTVNEELRNLGYTLKPGDILALAASRSVDGFAEHFRSLLPKVDAPPMYPDFPSQVMEMEEAVISSCRPKCSNWCRRKTLPSRQCAAFSQGERE